MSFLNPPMSVRLGPRSSVTPSIIEELEEISSLGPSLPWRHHGSFEFVALQRKSVNSVTRLLNSWLSVRLSQTPSPVTLLSRDLKKFRLCTPIEKTNLIQRFVSVWGSPLSWVLQRQLRREFTLEWFTWGDTVMLTKLFQRSLKQYAYSNLLSTSEETWNMVFIFHLWKFLFEIFHFTSYFLYCDGYNEWKHFSKFSVIWLTSLLIPENTEVFQKIKNMAWNIIRLYSWYRISRIYIVF